MIQDKKAEARIFLFFLAFSALWSWPLVLSPASTLVSLHFDQLPAAWLVHNAPDFMDGISQTTGWPEGEPLKRLDSFLFLLIALFLQGLVPGLFLTNLFVLLGPATSAWAADLMARNVLNLSGHAPRIAGLAFGFAPLATVSVLEGHVYYLLDPWLPLMVMFLWKPGFELAAAGCWALALLTTAYLGIDATLLAGAILLYQRRIPVKFVAASAVMGVLYASLFLGSGATVDRDDSDALVRLGSASLTTLIAWSPWMDLNRHSLAPAVGLMTLALALVSWRIPSKDGRFFVFLGLVAMVLSVGPVLELGVARAEAIPTLLYPALKLGLFDTFRFPIRFAWISALGFGMGAALLASQLSGPRGVLALLVLAALDTTLISGGIFRIRAHPAPIPSLYHRLPEGALLELYPEVGGSQEDISFYQQNLSCYYQTSHHRPIFDLCLNTNIDLSPRRAAARELHHLVLDSAGSVRDFVQAKNISSIVLHADLYQSAERAELISGLTTSFGTPVAEGTDGGEWLIAWEIGTLSKR